MSGGVCGRKAYLHVGFEGRGVGCHRLCELGSFVALRADMMKSAGSNQPPRRECQGC